MNFEEENTISTLPELRYFIINKPYNMVSQFISSHKVNLLSDLPFKFPAGSHAVGRLDINSEGLLIVTTDKKVTRLLFEAEVKHTRTYLVQVDNVVSEETLHKLKMGVTIKIKGGVDYVTNQCVAQLAEKPKDLFEGGYKSSPYKTYSWLLITLTEGKFRQVRKMVAAVNHPCRRLIRVSIENLTLGNLQPGCIAEISKKDFFDQLKIAE